MKRGVATLALMPLLSALAQQLPVRDDPLYDLLTHRTRTPSALARVPRSMDEFLRIIKPLSPSGEEGMGEGAMHRTLAENPSPQPSPQAWGEGVHSALSPACGGEDTGEGADGAVAILQWRLRQAERLSPQRGALLLTLDGFGYPTDSDWATSPKGVYRVVGLFALGEQALLEMVASDSARREGTNPAAFDTVPLARLTFRTGDWEWQLGRANLRWAGGYSGALLINDAMPPVLYARVAFPMRLPLIGEWQFEQFFAQFEQDGQTVWWGGRRFSRSLGSRWSLSLAEAFKALRLPNGAVSQIVPYYLYQKWMSRAEIGSGWFNYLAEIGITYRLNETDRLYLFWLIDDIRAPDLLGGRGANTPRKVATLVGIRIKPTPDTRLILEGVLTDGTDNGGTYGAAGHDPRYAYTYQNLPMGHPFDSNRRGLYARFEWERGRWLIAAEGINIGRFHDWLPGERGYQFDLQLGYQIAPNGLISLRYRTRHLRDSSLPDARCGWWLQWTQQL